MEEKGLKWYFCLSQGAKNIYQYEIRAAVNSALENTTLRPHFIYDGTPDDLTKWLENKGVKVIFHKVSFAAAFEKFTCPYASNTALGAFLRIDIPLIEIEDDYVLYTDTDVVFNKDIKLEEMGRPELFSAATQNSVDDWSVFNSGVMIMNVANMKSEHNAIVDFICNFHNGNEGHKGMLDQEVLNELYLKNNKFTKLSELYNHKPYWGINKEAFIVHYHGPKPYNVKNALENNLGIWEVFQELLSKSFMGYKYYYDVFENYCGDIHVDINTLYNYVNTERLNRLIVDEEKKKDRLLKIKVCKKIITFYINKVTVENIR